jgi:hypothetical protein
LLNLYYKEVARIFCPDGTTFGGGQKRGEIGPFHA